jgi:hypothetical protein
MRDYDATSPRTAPAPEQIVIDELVQTDLWQIVLNTVESEQERILLVENVTLKRPPRAILARHPNLFPDIQSFYRTKRNLVARLKHNSELQRLYEDILSA